MKKPRPSPYENDNQVSKEKKGKYNQRRREYPDPERIGQAVQRHNGNRLFGEAIADHKENGYSAI